MDRPPGLRPGGLGAAATQIARCYAIPYINISALPVTSARHRAIILRGAGGRRSPRWRSAVATVVLFLAQIAIYHIECRFGGLLSHGERNQSTQPGQLVREDIDMPGVHRRILILRKRRISRRRQVHRGDLRSGHIKIRLSSSSNDDRSEWSGEKLLASVGLWRPCWHVAPP